MSKRIKLEKKFEYRKKGNQIQHEFNEPVAASMEEAAASLKEKEGLAKMKETLQEGLKLLSERQKLLNITVIISPACKLLCSLCLSRLDSHQQDYSLPLESPRGQVSAKLLNDMISSGSLLIMLALCSMLSYTYYAHFNAGIKSAHPCLQVDAACIVLSTLIVFTH